MIRGSTRHGYQFKWREPWLMRMRLHGDGLSRLAMSLACVFATGAIFFLVGLAEKGWSAAPIAAAIGAVFIGGVVSLGILLAPEGIFSGVTIDERTVRRVRETVSFGQSEHVREVWKFPGLYCVIVPVELLHESFSVMVLPSQSGKRATFVGVPNHVDLAKLESFLSGVGVNVESATSEMADSVRADRPYRSCLIRVVIGVCVLVSLGIVATVAFAGNQIAGN